MMENSNIEFPSEGKSPEVPCSELYLPLESKNPAPVLSISHDEAYLVVQMVKNLPAIQESQV